MTGLSWTARILDFPVRAAAVDDFLRDLKAHAAADLNALQATLNDGDLCRETLRQWTERGWISVAPHSPTMALPGPRFHRDVGLREFCGAETAPGEQAHGPSVEGPDQDRPRPEEGGEDDGGS